MTLNKFRTYQMAKELYLELQKVKLKPYAKDQILRATQSVALNLVEGSGKLSLKDRKRFYNIAYGSIKEVQACCDLHNLKEFEKADQLGAMIYKLILALDRLLLADH